MVLLSIVTVMLVSTDSTVYCQHNPEQEVYLKQVNDISKAVDGIESKITEIREEIEGIEKVSADYDLYV